MIIEKDDDGFTIRGTRHELEGLREFIAAAIDQAGGKFWDEPFPNYALSVFCDEGDRHLCPNCGKTITEKRAEECVMPSDHAVAACWECSRRYDEEEEFKNR